MQTALKKLNDRCDRCRAEAFVIAEKKELTLLFCGHHGREYRTVLEALDWTILDFTDEIG